MLGNFESFSGHIASCFIHSLSCFTKDSQKSSQEDLVKFWQFIADI